MTLGLHQRARLGSFNDVSKFSPSSRFKKDSFQTLNFHIKNVKSQIDLE